MRNIHAQEDDYNEEEDDSDNLPPIDTTLTDP